MLVYVKYCAVGHELYDDGRRNVVEHKFGELLGLLDLPRQLALLGHVLEQGHQKLPLAPLVTRHYPPRPEGTLLRAAPRGGPCRG